MDGGSVTGGPAAVAARISLELGRLHLEVALDVAAGEVLAVLGPNGSGKSTLLRCLAGLQAIDDGCITIEGVVVDEPEHRSFTFPERRGVGVVFQDHLLFPNLDLLSNVAFGLRARGVGKADADERAGVWLARVGLGGLERSRPVAVSGGQAQRAALARALVTDPAVLLLDEPLSALDAGSRSAVRRDLRRHLGSFSGATLLVTHDALDALALADRVAVLEDGRITQTGTLTEVTSMPRTTYVAELMGTNLLTGIAEGTEVTVRHPDALGATDRTATLIIADAVDGPVLVLVRPSSVTLHRDEPTGSPRNRWRVTVSGLDLLGDRVRVRLEGPVPLIAEVTSASVTDMGLVEGTRVWAAVKATDLTVIER